MHSLWVGLLALSAPATAVALPEQDAGAELAKMVQEAQKAGIERHDLRQYLSVWSDDAKRIEGRTEQPDTYDAVLPRAQLEATRTLLYAVPPPKGVKAEFADVRTNVQGDSATVRYRLMVSEPGSGETTEELFRLRRKDGKWQVVENRSWLIE